MEKSKGLKKVKFYDWMLWVSLFIVILVFIIISGNSYNSLGGYLALALPIFLIVFYVGMMYWMIKTKRFFLFFFSILFPVISLFFYFSYLRKRFKEGDF